MDETPQGAPSGRGNGWGARTIIAAVVVIFSIVALTVLGVFVVNNDQTDALTLFNVLLPVMATWVGTVLAFYFGRENFESASEQVRSSNEQLIELTQATQQERAGRPVTQIMRPIAAMTYLSLDSDNSITKVTIARLRKSFSAGVTRLPVVDANLKPLYMIHESSVDKYLSDPAHDAARTLDQFIDDQAKVETWYDHQRGFAIVAETASIGDVRQAVEASRTVQDVFVTARGTPDEPMVGWVSNTRLSKYLKA